MIPAKTSITLNGLLSGPNRFLAYHAVQNLRRHHRDNSLKLVKNQKLLLTVVIVWSNEHSTGPSVFYTLISVSLKRLDSSIRYLWGKISKFLKTIGLHVYWYDNLQTRLPTRQNDSYFLTGPLLIVFVFLDLRRNMRWSYRKSLKIVCIRVRKT